MTWGAIAVGAVSAVGAAVSASSANKAGAKAAGAAANGQYNSAAESFRATELKYKQLQQDYKANDQQNLMTQVRQNYRMGLMNVQKGMMRRDATAKGFDTTQQAAAYMGSVSANAGAAQVIGASSDAVKNDIRMKAGEAQATHEQNYQQQLQNFNSEVEALRLNNETQFQSPREILTSSTGSLSDPIKVSTDYNYTNPWAAGAMAGIGSFAGQYLKSSTSLNLGATTAGQATTASAPLATFGDLGASAIPKVNYNLMPTYGVRY